MIKLFIQGRKDGYKVLYPKPTPSEFFQFAGDLRPDGNNNQLLGKSFYTLALAPGGHIFTKQLIIQDVQRQGLGNIGISLFISAQKKIAGEQMIQLLDELVKTYALNYCPDNYLDFVQEDWTIFEKIVTKYSSNLQVNVEDDQENLQPGAKDPAYLYYSDELELARFFDAPAQEEYIQFKQVFFIDKSLENQPYNPLKAIRHNLNGNLTGKIDLNNLSYRLIYSTLSQGGIRLEIKVNGMPILNKNQIKRNDQLEISWSKPYQETRIKKGTCIEIGSTYLLINEDSRTITIKDIALNDRMFKFQVKAQDKFSRPILDAELIAYSQINKRERTLVNNSIILREEELNENYYVFGKKGNLVSEPMALTKMAANEEITLTLLETVKLTIKPRDNRNSNYLSDAKITLVNKSNSGHSAEFRGDEINKNWQIIISHPEYRTKTITYCPATEPSELVIQLEKLPLTEAPIQPQQDRKSYRLVIDPKKGKETWKGEALDLSGREFQQEDTRCDARYGYKFSGWKIVEVKGQMEIYEAIFQDLWYRKVPKVVWGILPVFIAAGIYFSLHPDAGGGNGGGGTTAAPSKTRIEEYLNGDALFLDNLLEFKNSPDSILLKDEELSSKLDKAIEFRKLLNKGDFKLLVEENEQFFVSANQQELKKIIEELLKNENKNAIISSLKDSIVWDLKTLSLDEIGEKIDSLKTIATTIPTAGEAQDGPAPGIAANPGSSPGAVVGGSKNDEIIRKINQLLSAVTIEDNFESWDELLRKADASGNVAIKKDIESIKKNLKEISKLDPEQRTNLEKAKKNIKNWK